MSVTIKEFQKGVATKITTNFSSKEFDCNCTDPSCTKTLVCIEHVERLQHLRDMWGNIKIDSGYRCEAHNASIGGVSKSQHKLGLATDIVCFTRTPDEVADALDKDWAGGMGRYNTFTHIDSRPSGRARWDFRKKE